MSKWNVIVRWLGVALVIVGFSCNVGCGKEFESDTILPCNVKMYVWEIRDPLGYGSKGRLKFENLNDYPITIEAFEARATFLPLWATRLDIGASSEWLSLKIYTHITISSNAEVLYAFTSTLAGYRK